jgi:type II secretory pathway component GspD/PulD (secretin)
MSDRIHNVKGRHVKRLAHVLAGSLVALAGTTGALAQDRDPFAGGELGNDSTVEVSDFMTVDLHVQDEDLANVLQLLSIQSQRNIVMSSDVSATVTANLYDVTFYEALESILNVNGYGFLERGNFIYVYTLDEIAQIEAAARQPVYRVVKLDYLNANDAAEFVAPLLSEIGQIRSNGDVTDFNIPDNAPVGGEDFALSATIMVYDYPEHVEEIEKLIAQIDSRPAQVLVEATILQAELSEANAFGIDFSIIGDLDFTDFTNTGGPLSAVNSLIAGGDGSEGQGFTPNGNAQAGVSTAGNTAGPATFKLGVVSDDFAIFMRLLDEVTDFTVMSNPKVLTLNRQPARVLVGRRVGFLSTTATETSTTQSVEFLDTGTQLAFRPFVSNDGFIRMELKPSVSEASIRDTTNADGVSVTIPDEITQEIATNVIVRDGSTIVLGGLFKEATTVTRRQVPVVGDLPIIGAAFKGHDDRIDRAEIIFMVKPSIVNDSVLIAEGERAAETVELVRTGSRRGLLPFSREKMSAKLNLQAERLAKEGKGKKAMHKLRRSLRLNPQQPDALRLREQLLDEYEAWPSRDMLDYIYDESVSEAISELPDISQWREVRKALREQRKAEKKAERAEIRAQKRADKLAAKNGKNNVKSETEPVEVTNVDDNFDDEPFDPTFDDGDNFDDNMDDHNESPVVDDNVESSDASNDTTADATEPAATEEVADADEEDGSFDPFDFMFDDEAQDNSANTAEPVDAEPADAEPAEAQPPVKQTAQLRNPASPNVFPWELSDVQKAEAVDAGVIIPGPEGDLLIDANGLPAVRANDMMPWEPIEYSGMLFSPEFALSGASPANVQSLAAIWRYYSTDEFNAGALTSADDDNRN